MVVRGCGTRVKGGVYIEVKLSPFGVPVECFVLDPPQPLDKDGMGLSEIGMKIIYDPNGVPHLLDWVGEANYPNVQDFLEETRRHGVSRRISNRFDLSVLTPESRLLLVHRKAIIRNAHEYFIARLTEKKANCPQCAVDGCFGHFAPFSEQCRHHREPQVFASLEDMAQRAAQHQHNGWGEWQTPIETCSDLWNDDVEGGTIPDDPAISAPPADQRHVYRQVGDTGYHARRRPADIEPRYAPGIFLALPISNVAVINDPDDQTRVQEIYQRVSDVLNGLPVFLEDE